MSCRPCCSSSRSFICCRYPAFAPRRRIQRTGRAGVLRRRSALLCLVVGTVAYAIG
jgi:hypothetical protein